MNYGLTARQSKLLEFIAGFISQEGFCPSYRQMMATLNIRSSGDISRLVKSLEERGCIRRMPNRGRTIEVLVPVKIEHQITTAPLKEALADYSMIDLRRELVRRQEGAAA